MKLLENTKVSHVWRCQIILCWYIEIKKDYLKCIFEKVCTNFDWYVEKIIFYNGSQPN